jgi:hypothetical protein
VALRPTKPAVIWAGAFALAICVGAVAHADPAHPVGTTDDFTQHDDFTPAPSPIGPQVTHRTLQWDARKGRWGLNVDMTQPADRDPDWRDTRIGAYYRVTPGLRTGVGVTLGAEQPPDPHALAPEEPSPRVRLETTFKF